MKIIEEIGFTVSEPFLPFTAFINKESSGVHWHSYIELLYMIKGKAMMKINKETYKFLPGEFMIINIQEPHAAQFYEELGSEMLVLQFEPFVISTSFSLLFESKYIIPFLQHEVLFSRLIKVEDEYKLKSLINGIFTEFKSKNVGYELNIKGDIYKIFSWLIRNNHISTLSNSNHLLRLKKLFDYVEHNYNEKITNEMAAIMVNMSYHYFCRFFKKTTGKTFTQYLNYVRLHEAESLLLSSNNTIVEIALSTGFNSVSYFNRLFKKEKGLPPLAFKKAK